MLTYKEFKFLKLNEDENAEKPLKKITEEFEEGGKIVKVFFNLYKNHYNVVFFDGSNGYEIFNSNDGVGKFINKMTSFLNSKYNSAAKETKAHVVAGIYRLINKAEKETGKNLEYIKKTRNDIENKLNIDLHEHKNYKKFEKTHGNLKVIANVYESIDLVDNSKKYIIKFERVIYDGKEIPVNKRAIYVDGKLVNVTFKKIDLETQNKIRKILKDAAEEILKEYKS